MDVIVLFPGQGSQRPGMGKDVAEAFPAARAVFDAADRALGDSLSTLCFEGPADTLTMTRNAQPALLTHSAAVWAVVRDALWPHVRAAAGHSLGEFTAYHAAQTFTLDDAVRLVRQRGELMQQAGIERLGTMAAVLGDPSEPIEAICERASQAPDGGLVVPANFNSPGQTVISGEVAGVDKAIELLRAAGVKRAIKLPVSGAFHSPLMSSARDGLAGALATLSLRDPHVPVYANVTGGSVTSAETARELLVQQLLSPVRWTEVVQRLAADFPDAVFVEIGAGTVLTGLVRKIIPQARTANCGTAPEVEQLLETLRQ